MPEFAWLNWLAQTGHLADFAIVCLIIEAALGLRGASGSPARRVIIFNVLSGIALMLALRVALTGGSATLIALFLSSGFVAHLGELAARRQS